MAKLIYNFIKYILHLKAPAETIYPTNGQIQQNLQKEKKFPILFHSSNVFHRPILVFSRS